MRTVLIALAALLATAGIACAQVAAPSLNPVPTFSQAPINPAVLSWDGPSRVGASYGKFEAKQPAAPINPVAKGKVASIQAEYVGSNFAAAAAGQQAKLDIDPLVGGGTLHATGQFIGIAAQYAEIVSAGIAQELQKNSDPSRDEVQTIPLAGATLRLASIFYLGGAMGTATVEDHVISPSDQVKQKVTRLGVAVHWRDQTRGVHLEAYQERRPDAASAVTTLEALKSDTSGGTVEVVLANILLGFEAQTEKTEDAAGVPKDQTKSRQVSLGFVPSSGLAIVAEAFNLETTDRTSGGTIVKSDGASLGVSWLF